MSTCQSFMIHDSLKIRMPKFKPVVSEGSWNSPTLASLTGIASML